MSQPLAPRGPSAAQLLHAALRRSAAQLDPALRAQLSDADTIWALALVLGVWAGLPVLPSGWLKDAITAGIAPYRQVEQAQPVVRAAWAAGSARSASQVASAARSLATGLQSLGSEALGMLAVSTVPREGSSSPRRSKSSTKRTARKNTKSRPGRKKNSGQISLF
jgi:hypothetical protein